MLVPELNRINKGRLIFFLFFQAKLDMELSVKHWLSSYLLSLFAVIILMKNRFWGICSRWNLIVVYLICTSTSCNLVDNLIISSSHEQYYQSGVEMIRRDLLTGHWKPYLERAISLKPCYEGGTNGGEVWLHNVSPSCSSSLGFYLICLLFFHR